MLTPQDINDKVENGFVKAVFGGYDMGNVEEFLETVSADYNTLYKENAILKGKLKVLVEKVEEYRTTEDAMRMALLTAQRMGEEITIEATRTKDEMLQNAENEVKSKLADTAKRIAEEELRLNAASKETAKFLELSKAILSKHSEFLKKLETAHRTIKPKAEPAQVEMDVEPDVDAAAKPMRTNKQTQTAKQNFIQPIVPVTPEHQIQPTASDLQEVEFDDIASQISSAVADIANFDPTPVQPAKAAPSLVEEPHPSLFEEDNEPISIYQDSEDDVPEISPRPKFDFDDLKFGANFDSDE